MRPPVYVRDENEPNTRRNGERGGDRAAEDRDSSSDSGSLFRSVVPQDPGTSNLGQRGGEAEQVRPGGRML